jgi:hypothetical protein
MSAAVKEFYSDRRLMWRNLIWLAVWHFDGGPEEIAIPLTGLNIRGIACIYPASRPPVFQWLADQEAVVVSIPCRTSRIFELTYIQ